MKIALLLIFLLGGLCSCAVEQKKMRVPASDAKSPNVKLSTKICSVTNLCVGDKVGWIGGGNVAFEGRRMEMATVTSIHKNGARRVIFADEHKGSLTPEETIRLNVKCNAHGDCMGDQLELSDGSGDKKIIGSIVGFFDNEDMAIEIKSESKTYRIQR